MKRGRVTGKIRVEGVWDDISINMDNYHIYYLGHVLTNFNEDNILELINKQTSSGKMVLSDGIKPLQYMNRFKL